MCGDRLNRPTSGFATRRHMLEYEAALVDAAKLDAAFEVRSLEHMIPCAAPLRPLLMPEPDDRFGGLIGKHTLQSGSNVVVTA